MRASAGSRSLSHSCTRFHPLGTGPANMSTWSVCPSSHATYIRTRQLKNRPAAFVPPTCTRACTRLALCCAYSCHLPTWIWLERLFQLVRRMQGWVLQPRRPCIFHLPELCLYTVLQRVYHQERQGDERRRLHTCVRRSICWRPARQPCMYICMRTGCTARARCPCWMPTHRVLATRRIGWRLVGWHPGAARRLEHIVQAACSMESHAMHVCMLHCEYVCSGGGSR